LPALSVLVVQVDVFPVTGEVQSVVVPSLNVTVPTPPGLGLTVAVNVTDWPKTLGLLFDARVVDVGVVVTVNLKK
jgi:hypothetical protein